MRRSGTTIVFDILSQDRRFDLYYEPFSLGRKGALGGGSGIQKIDLMEKIRLSREHFIYKNDLPLSGIDFNWGAPSNPLLELETELPLHCIEYIKYLLSADINTVIKFTRMYRKIPVLKSIAPDSKLILIIRHPQEIVGSYIYGRNQSRRKKFSNKETFFKISNSMNPWKSLDFFNGIIKEKGLEYLEHIPNWIRYLLIWKYTFENTYNDGKKCFKDAFLIIRHEDLVRHTKETITKIYNHIEMSIDKSAVQWAESNLRFKKKQLYKMDPRWHEAYKILNMEDCFYLSGYEPISSI